MSKQKLNITQKNKLLDLIANKPLLRAGKFTQNLDAQKQWEEITDILNSIPGANKEWKAWRKTWQDILSKTKSKTAAINKIRRGTGGGPPPPDSLDEFEEGVASLLHPHAVCGHTESLESEVIFEDEPPYLFVADAAIAASVTPPPMELSEPEPQSTSQINDSIIMPPPIDFAAGSGVSGAQSAISLTSPHTNGKQKQKKKK